MTEFELIRRYLRPLAAGERGALGLSDDAAVIAPPDGRDLVLTADTLVEGVHFLAADPPDTVARKLLRVNLSDLAAKGASPFGYLLSLALPRPFSEAWMSAFADGLGADQGQFGIGLLGGDTVASPGPATLSLTALGSVMPGAMLLRSDAKPGDDLYVSGTIGDGYLGLRVLENPALADALGVEASAYLIARYQLPEPRLALGQAMAEEASAAADISDGLVADLGHICEASEAAAEIELPNVPFSDAARRALQIGFATPADLIAGGDDYELVLTGPAGLADNLPPGNGAPLTRIGRIIEGAGVRVLDAGGRPIPLQRRGYEHG